MKLGFDDLDEVPFELKLDDAMLASLPAEIRGHPDHWLKRCAKKIHDELMRSDFPYRNSFEVWKKMKGTNNG